MIPRRISLFWHGRMSWMRFLTLQTFRLHNPDWEIHLYHAANGLSAKTWSTPESEDHGYNGDDYSPRLDGLNVERHEFISPVAGVAAAQASDLMTWSVLATGGGFCADMDILWLRPLDDVWQRIRSADAVFCLEDGFLAVGFLAGIPYCQVFADILATAADITAVNQYQTFGTDLIYRTFPTWERSRDPAGVKTLRQIRRIHPRLAIETLSDETVYPFDWREIDQIFSQSRDIPGETVGLHWFGGSPLAQEWNQSLTADNWQQYQNTFTRCLQVIGI